MNVNRGTRDPIRTGSARRLSRPRTAVPAAAGVLLTMALGGCAPEPTVVVPEQSGPEEAVTEFLAALADGDLADALALSTADAAEFACASMVANDVGRAIAAPEVVRITEDVDGSHATAEVEYTSRTEWTETLELVLDGEQWRVELPDGFEIALGFDAPVVADLVIDEDCRVPVDGTTATITAWPGTYRIDLDDPTGVFPRTEQMLVTVPAGLGVVGVDVDPAALPAIPEGDLAVLGAEVAPLLADAFAACAASGFTAARCPHELSEATVPATAVPSPEYLSLARVWTTDGRMWRFQSGFGSIETVAEGGPAIVEFDYTGILTREGGQLALQLTG